MSICSTKPYFVTSHEDKCIKLWEFDNDNVVLKGTAKCLYFHQFHEVPITI